MSEEQAEHFNQRMKANEQTLARLAKKRRFKHSDYQDLLAQITAIAVTNDTKMQDVLNKLMELYGAYTDVLEKQLELIFFLLSAFFSVSLCLCGNLSFKSSASRWSLRILRKKP